MLNTLDALEAVLTAPRRSFTPLLLTNLVTAVAVGLGVAVGLAVGL